MLDCLDAARYFIIKAYDAGIASQMTNMKVQKLLYYAQSIHLALYGELLFADEIQAWRHGPVCPPAYQFYREFEDKQLPIPNLVAMVKINPATRQVLDEVWEYFGGYHAYRLSDMSHLEFPWKKARQGLSTEAASNNPIALEDLRALGEQKLEIIEREHPAYPWVMQDVLTAALATKPTVRVEKGGVRDWLESILD
ncbi:Panacea domain-containing protein [Alkalinema pantanalense CENA528]|uniref:Panacea domain-containing protein n=1 Tax=Alkalinema pantanalense TaxID=1620705 RepID=UPI003D6DE245